MGLLFTPPPRAPCPHCGYHWSIEIGRFTHWPCCQTLMSKTAEVGDKDDALPLTCSKCLTTTLFLGEGEDRGKCPACDFPLGEKFEITKDIVAEPILAWRIWNVVVPTQVSLDQAKIEKMQREMREGYDPFSGLLSPTLRGVGVAQDWDSPTHHATCEAQSVPAISFPSGTHRDDVRVPAEKCTCGIWALKDEITMLEQLANYNKGAPMAYGQVHLWGRVFEHEKGFRGEYAKPVSISAFGVDEHVASGLMEKYGCEVELCGAPKTPEVAGDLQSYFQAQMSQYYSASQYTVTWSGTTNVSMTKAITEAADEEFPTFWDKIKHPWSKGPLKWMYRTEDWARRTYEQDPDFLGWTFLFKEWLSILLFFAFPVILPPYYLKRALTR